MYESVIVYEIDVLSLDVEGHEPIAVSTLGNELSYGVVRAEVEGGAAARGHDEDAARARACTIKALCILK